MFSYYILKKQEFASDFFRIYPSYSSMCSEFVLSIIEWTNILLRSLRNTNQEQDGYIINIKENEKNKSAYLCGYPCI